MTTELPNTDAQARRDGSALERPVKPLDPKRDPVAYAEWLADKLHNGGDFGKEAAALLVKQAQRVAALKQALLLALGAILQCSPCAAEECHADQVDWLETARAAIERELAA